MSESKKIVRTDHLRTIKMGLLRVSPVAQRDLNTARVKHILDDLNLDKLGTLTVSERDGFFYIIDGQHRWVALRNFLGDGWEDVSVEAWCWTGLSEQEEAHKFLEFNDSLTVDEFSRFKVGVTADLPVPTDINRIVTSLGLKVTRSKTNGGIAAVSGLNAVYLKLGGPATLQKTLTIVRDSFGDIGFESVIVKGVARMYTRYEGKLDADRLVKKLNATNGGYKNILQRARLVREQNGAYMDLCVAAVITEIYNSGLRGKASLGRWWREEDHALAA